MNPDTPSISSFGASNRALLRACVALLSLGVLLGCGPRARIAAAQTETTTNLLIIGHSWTSKSGDHINTLVEPVGDLWAKNVIHGGYSLENQWNDPNQMSQIIAELERGIYDYAAIMDFASLIIDELGTGVHETYVRKFDDLFQSYNVETVLLLPWAYVAFPEIQPILTANEYALAAELGVMVAPIGEAFKLSGERRPDLLLTKDNVGNSHANPLGAYLRDITLYASVMNKAPTELAGEFGLTQEDEAHFKAVAWQVVQTWNGGVSPPPTAAPTETAAATATTAATEAATAAPTDTSTDTSTGTATEPSPTPTAGSGSTETGTPVPAAPPEDAGDGSTPIASAQTETASPQPEGGPESGSAPDSPPVADASSGEPGISSQPPDRGGVDLPTVIGLAILLVTLILFIRYFRASVR